MAIEFIYMEPPFGTKEKRHELKDRLNKIQWIYTPLNKIYAEPHISM